MNSKRSFKEPLENRLGWSFSRHRMREDCLRKIYWQYYGSWKGWEDDSPPSARLSYQLKSLTTPPLVVGNVVHNVLGRWLRTHEPGQTFPLSRVTKEAIREFDAPHKPVTYWSDVYSDGVDEEVLAESRRRITWLLRRASQNDYVKHLARIRSDRIVVADATVWAEKKVEYGDIDLFGMPDVLAYSDDGTPNFIDWKTGRDEARSADVQMGAQALFAREKFGIRLGSAKGHVVYLDSGDVTRIDDLESAAEHVESLIKSFVDDIRRRLSRSDSSVAGDVDQFPMTSETSRCTYCNFKRLCDR